MIRVHLIDGTYELFRHFYGQRDESTRTGTAAVRGVLSTVLQTIDGGASHVGVATDHVIESFRNRLWPGYKTSAGMDPNLLAVFPLLEEALIAMGVKTYAMVELEADDALATAAVTLAAQPDDAVHQVVIMTPDKDLGQCVRGKRIVQFDRRNKKVLDEAAVAAKFGVPPSSIADYLALVGDSADGFPGIAGFGAKTAAAVLRVYGNLDKIPADGRGWDVPGLRSPQKLAATLQENIELAYLFRTLATLQVELGLLAGGPEQLRWKGPTDAFEAFCARIDAGQLAERAAALAAARS